MLPIFIVEELLHTANTSAIDIIISAAVRFLVLGGIPSTLMIYFPS